MKNYRLKIEALPFFKEDFATAIKPFDFWDEKNIDTKALEEVEDVHVTFGIPTNEFSSLLGGWDKEGAHFHFTLNFPFVKYEDYPKIKRDEAIRGLMDLIQQQANQFYNDFVAETEQETKSTES